jgi:predicted ABC-type ATPase
MTGVIRALVEMGVIPEDGKRTSGDIRWQAVFFMGAAGSGKSWVRSKKYLKYMDFKVIDPDEIKKTHPNYDPENHISFMLGQKKFQMLNLKK